MSVRRRARKERQRRWAGWVSDERGPAVSVHADREPSDAAVAAILDIRDAVLAAWRRADLEVGRWEDDGGASAPDHVHRTFSLVTGRQGGSNRHEPPARREP